VTVVRDFFKALQEPAAGRVGWQKYATPALIAASRTVPIPAMLGVQTTPARITIMRERVVGPAVYVLTALRVATTASLEELRVVKTATGTYLVDGITARGSQPSLVDATAPAIQAVRGFFLELQGLSIAGPAWQKYATQALITASRTVPIPSMLGVQTMPDRIDITGVRMVGGTAYVVAELRFSGRTVVEELQVITPASGEPRVDGITRLTR
jgi:hypothetical protein